MAAIAATAMLASCSEEAVNKGGDDNGPAKAAVINIKLAGVQSRALTGYDNEYDEDSKVNDMIVFITKADGNTFDVSPKYISSGIDLDGNGTTAKTDNFDITATTNAANVFIVTNTGPYVTGPFKSVRNMDDVKKVAIDINNNTHGVPAADYKCKNGNVWMSGKSTGAFTDGTTLPGPDGEAGTEDDILVKTTNVTLEYVVAKVAIVTNNKMTGDYSAATANTKLDGVTLINAGRWAGFVKGTNGFEAEGRDATRTPYHYNGVELALGDPAYFDAPDKYNTVIDHAKTPDASKSNYTNTIGFSDMTADPNGAVATSKTDDNLTDADYFYVTPTFSGSNAKVYASVYGKYNPDGLDKSTGTKNAFWSAPFGGQAITSPLAAGNKYIVTFNLTGDVNTGGGYKEDPTVETVNQKLTITVTSAAWTVKKPVITIE
jgi:hypothetical protein